MSSNLNIEELAESIEKQDIVHVAEIFKFWFNELIAMLPSFMVKIIMTCICIFVGKKIINIIVLSIQKIMDSRKSEPLLESFTLSLIKNLLHLVLFFFIVGILGIKATSLVTILGAAGIAIGLALQGSLSNLAGGVLILIFKPFSKGDYISNNSDIEGTVDQIQIFNSILITADNKVIIVPNGQLANGTLVNFSKNSTRRLDLIFPVALSTNIEHVLVLLRKVSEENPKILQEKAKIIRVGAYGQNSMDIWFRVWVRSNDYWDVMFDCNENVKKIFDKNNIETPSQKIDIYQK